MKHKIIVAAAFLVSSMSFAQFQVSVSAGQAVSSAGMKLGEEININETKNSYGSYGAGTNVQVRGTYFFNEKFGTELALGYLHGNDQTVSKVDIPGVNETDAIARARAFGASASMVYNFTPNFYGRLGALIKIGGKTEAVVSSNALFTEDVAAAQGLPSGTRYEVDYVEDFHGHMPLGFVGALGYKFDLDDNFAFFVEAEYYGISLKRKDSELTEFNMDVYLPESMGGTLAANYNLDNLPAGYNKETTYVDELSNTNTDSSKKLSQKVPYSSFGINFGITYKFKRKAAKTTTASL